MSEQLPQESFGDKAHLIARMGLSAIPLLGGPSSELFNWLITTPVQRRRNEWMTRLSQRLEELERQGRVEVKNLQENEEFISAVIQASQVALRNHQQEKLQALENAVLKMATGHAVEDAKREMFLSFVDVLTVWHLRVLDVLANPPANTDIRQLELDLSCGHRHGVLGVVLQALPELQTQQEFANKIIEDLIRHSLVLSDIAFRTSAGVQTMPCLTPLGGEFMEFVTSGEAKGSDHTA